MKAGIVIDRRTMAHEMGAGHPECPERIEVLLEAIEKHGLPAGAQLVVPRKATHEELVLVHEPRYVQRIQATAGVPHTYLDPDTSASAGSYEAALLAAGGLLSLVERALDGSIETGFALVRPPGHHATAGRAMGFCIFNNVAVAARSAVRTKGVGKVLIVDWDVHHGNGTQDAFYGDPQVLYFSTHRYPGFYPGSGGPDEVGAGKAQGTTVNVPMPYGCGDAEYLDVFRRVLAPIASQFAPGLILVSAGFDPHEADPLGGMRVTARGFGEMASILLALGGRLGGAPVLFALEGGYSLEGLRDSVMGILKVMSAGPGPAAATEMPAPSRLDKHIESIWKIQSRFWKQTA